MKNYWSCSTLADKIRGTIKPSALELGKWDEWDQYAKATHPIRYWLVEEGFDYVQNFINWPADRINSIRYWLNNRFVTRTHQLTSKLTPGQWHEFDERILHCVFDELVNFVEIEKAWMKVCWGDEETRKKYALPFWRKQWWTRWFLQWRCPQAGIDHLLWEMSLTNVDYTEPSDPNYGKPTHQALKAQEILDLYQWWTVVRPARPDPYDASGWTAYCEASREENGGKLFPMGGNDSTKLKKMSKAAHAKLDKMEKAYDAEDDAKLIQLIKLRKGLWT